ncbi:MAG: hypothetical protein K2W78_00120 [Xanthobacteraceae bacterium]|nr:hypothetical protein [Xanthobacteraceae bacterium]
MNVVLFIFNRPHESRVTFEAIRAVRPERLFIVADGPRACRATDHSLCAEARAVVADIDWPCEVHRNYSETNLGCARRVSSGLDWVFSQVEDAIILEDDCVADPSFFRFCSELLDKYRDVDRVMMIAGRSHATVDRLPGGDSYYFSKLPRIWGWATWRRSWAKFDFDLKDRPRHRELRIWPGHLFYRIIMRHILDLVLNGDLESWAYRWFYAVNRNDGLCITPSSNLIENVGFDEQATHTTVNDGRWRTGTCPMMFPLQHPDQIRALNRLDEIERRLLHPLSASEAFRHCEFRRWWREQRNKLKKLAPAR